MEDAAANSNLHITRGCDKAGRFRCMAFTRWCRLRKITPRFDAVGQHGSIAVIERFIRTLKDEGSRCAVVPMGFRSMSQELTAIAGLYNTHRPHSRLDGWTPEERYRRIPAACRRPRFEPRPLWPVASPGRHAVCHTLGRPG
jgi:transposase InsO family protein